MGFAKVKGFADPHPDTGRVRLLSRRKDQNTWAKQLRKKKQKKEKLYQESWAKTDALSSAT